MAVSTRLSRLLLSLFPMLLMASLTGCGGGGGGGGAENEGPPLELAVRSDAALDGLVWNRQGLLLGSNAARPAVGDLPHAQGHQVARAIYSFDLSQLPAGATIVAAEFRVFQSFIQGSPYDLFGALHVDHIAMGAVFAVEAWSGFTLGVVSDAAGQPAVLSASAELGYKTVDVTANLNADLLAGRLRSQFRVRGAADMSNEDASSDLATLSDGDMVATTLRPSLVVRYHLP